MLYLVMVPRWWPHKISSQSPKAKKGETFLFAAGVVLVIGAAVALNNYENRMNNRLDSIAAQASVVAVHPDNETEEDSDDKSKNNKKAKNSSGGGKPPQPFSTISAPSNAPTPTSGSAPTGGQQATPSGQQPSPPPNNDQPDGLGGLVQDLLCLPIICS